MFMRAIQVDSKQIMADLTHPEITEEPERVRESVTIHSDAYSATAGTHAVIICTEWDEFKVPTIDTH
jgi:UDPglucose 6-dehydrogenase